MPSVRDVVATRMRRLLDPLSHVERERTVVVPDAMTKD
jgi:hypothetical protein